MTATDELRRMLDERGVEYYRHEEDEPLRKLEKADYSATSWRIGGASVCAVPIEGSNLFDLWIDHCTPEQAVEATLGRGTCKVDTEESLFLNIRRWHICGCCGTGFSLWYYTEDGDECEETPHYCPNCGRRVVAGDA